MTPRPSCNQAAKCGAMKVLIADDDVVSRRVLEHAVESWGYQVACVADGEAAWRILAAENLPMVALLDWVMPHADGLEVARRIRSGQRRAPTYTIVVSARSSRDAVVQALESGVDDYILKPLDMRELRARIQIAVRLLETETALGRRVQELEQALEALNRSEESFRLLFSSIPHPTFVYDRETLNLLEVNQAVVKVYGYSREELLGMRISDLDAPVETAAGRHRTKDGRVLDVEISARDFDFRDHAAALLIAQDVTDRKRLETELRHSQRLESVGGLAAGIAHEINTPIQYVGDNTQFLEDSFQALGGLLPLCAELQASAGNGSIDGDLLRRFKEGVGTIDFEYLAREIPRAIAESLDGIERVATIVKAMKDFAHPGPKEKAATDLNKALETALLVSRNAVKYVADVETDFEALPPVFCRPADMNQVFLNLLVNAADAISQAVKGSGRKGRITVRTRREGPMAAISISDTGAGVPEAIRNRIFDPFFTTKEVGKGSGQGLAIVRSVVVDGHGGTVGFESTPGHGATFTVRLPIQPPAQTAAEAGQERVL